MFIKIMRKMSTHFGDLVSGAIEAEMPGRENIGVSREDANEALDDEVVDDRFVPLEQGLEDELEEGGDEAMKALKEKQRELIDALPLDQYVLRSNVFKHWSINPLPRYEIEAGAPGWAEAEKQVKNASKSGKKDLVVSVKSAKSKRKAGESAAEIYEQEMGEKAHKKAKKGSKKGH